MMTSERNAEFLPAVRLTPLEMEQKDGHRIPNSNEPDMTGLKRLTGSEQLEAITLE